MIWLISFALFVTVIIIAETIVLTKLTRINRIQLERDETRQEIERAKRDHKPVNHLYRKARELTNKELAS